MPAGTPSSDQIIDEDVVRRLLRSQYPNLANRPVKHIDAGWDNVMFRLGEDLVMRLPRRADAVPLIEHEQKWLPLLAPQLSMTVPVPVHVGLPSDDFHWPWSIVCWTPGETADVAPPKNCQATRMAEFLRALHQPAPETAPKNDFRGVPLQDRAVVVEQRLSALQGVSSLVTPTLTAIWQRALATQEATESCWLHGDLHAGNVLVNEGEISAIIDWGDLTSGDAATDLATVWMLFEDPNARRSCLKRYSASANQTARARGWAVFFGTILLQTGLVDHPRHAAMGEAILRRLSEDRFDKFMESASATA